MARRRPRWEEDDEEDFQEEFDKNGNGDAFDEVDEAAEEPVIDEQDDEAEPVEDEEPEEEEVAEVEEEPEEEIPLEPDNQDAIVALRELGARVDINDQGRVWRIFLYEKNRDNTAAQIHGFPLLQEVWLLGSKVSPQMVQRLREAYPKVKVYA